MEKDFQFHFACAGDFFQLIQRYLPLKDHPFEAQLPGKFHSGRVVDAHLGGSVQGQGGEIFADDGTYSRILHDQGIRAHLIQREQLLKKCAKLIFPNQRIEREINFFAVFPGKLQQFSQIFGGEIFGTHSGIEAAQTAVNRIRSAVKSGYAANFKDQLKLIMEQREKAAEEQYDDVCEISGGNELPLSTGDSFTITPTIDGERDALPD